MEKLNTMGIGPKIGMVTLPWFAASIYLTLKFRENFLFYSGENRILFYVGLAVLAAGAIMYILTIPSLLKGLKETKLMTGGTFYLCCSPLYASVILLIIPGISLMMNSWLVLTTSGVGYILFRIFIRSEYEDMERFFGEEYKEYRSSTPEFFPIPLKKWLRKGSA